jgi:hypothetical protein
MTTHRIPPMTDFCYIDVARTRIAENACHMIATHCRVTSPCITENTCHVIVMRCCVTSPCMRKLHAHCIATVHAQTQRKHFHCIVVWCVLECLYGATAQQCFEQICHNMFPWNVGWLSMDYMALSQKIVLFITTVVRTSNPTKLYLFRSFQY